ncbi:MAG: hypothetical protein A3K59_09810 [Euryarchaeota archaeon RBG_19FT_COMBO_69_17]|nr:MAG: hypothetical protein A3K59_09810 [Euryarchaeota archaeon RBG_19FT_COMBO_69_17]
MDGAVAFRRAFHVASPLFLGYYLIPEDLGGGITRMALTLLFLGTAACVEIARIALGVKLFGMRPYEGNRVSAYAQGTAALAVGIFVVREPQIVVPVFMGMAWIDPLAAYARKKGWTRGIPVLAYGALFLGIEAALSPFVPNPLSWPTKVLFAALATATAMPLEGPRIPQLDDDLLMQIVPMAVLAGTAFGLGAAGLL